MGRCYNLLALSASLSYLENQKNKKGEERLFLCYFGKAEICRKITFLRHPFNLISKWQSQNSRKRVASQLIKTGKHSMWRKAFIIFSLRFKKLKGDEFTFLCSVGKAKIPPPRVASQLIKMGKHSTW